jgi:hypothetical protein
VGAGERQSTEWHITQQMGELTILSKELSQSNNRKVNIDISLKKTNGHAYDMSAFREKSN